MGLLIVHTAYSMVPDYNCLWSLLGPVVKGPSVDFYGPCFSLLEPCDFYSNQAFHFPVVFIQTVFFQIVHQAATRAMSDLRLLSPLCF